MMESMDRSKFCYLFRAAEETEETMEEFVERHIGIASLTHLRKIYAAAKLTATDLIKQCGYSKNVALRADLHLGANTVEYWKSHDAMPYHTCLLFVMAYNVTGIQITE